MLQWAGAEEERMAVAGGKFLERAGRFLIGRREWLIIPFVVAALTLLSPYRLLGGEGVDFWVDLLGMLLVFCGQVIRMLVAGYSLKGTSARGRLEAGEALVTWGLYAYTRNPLYLGNFLIGLGLCIIYGSLLLFPLYFLFFALQYWPIMVAEEQFLREQFGEEYEEYRRTVPRFLPTFKPNPYKFQPWGKFSWKRCLRREASTVGGWMVLAAVAEMWTDYLVEGRKVLGEAEFILEVAGIALVAVSLLALRILKRCRALSKG